MSHDSSINKAAADVRAQERSRPRESFGEVLKKSEKHPPQPTGVPAKPAPPQQGAGAKPPPLPTARTAAVAQARTGPVGVALGVVTVKETLGRARVAMDAHASQLQTARKDGLAQSEQRIDGRVLDLIVKELTQEFGAEPDRSGSHGGAGGDLGRRVAQPEPASQGSSSFARHPDQAQVSAAANAPSAQVQPMTRAQAAVALVEKIETFVKSQRPAIALSVGGALNARVEVERTGRNEVAVRVVGKDGPPAAEDISRIREELRARGLRLSSLSVG